jgi:hypothetical protein
MEAAIDRAVVVPSYNLHGDVADKLVEDSEQAFVEGSFCQALQLANACLKGEGQSETDQHRYYRNKDATAGRIALQTPIELSFDMNIQRRWISIELNSPKDTSRVDRAAAVALQSWFEISQKAGSQQEQARGYRFLLPFLNEYTIDHQTQERSRCRAFSPELIVIFVQFCHATEHFHMAIELCSELVHSLLSFTSNGERLPLDKHQEKYFQEIVMLLLTRLVPFCDDPKAVTDLGKRMMRTDGASSTEWALTSTKWSACSVTSASSVRGVLALLANDERLSRWPEWLHVTVAECRTHLEILLQDLEDFDDDDDKAFLEGPRSQDGVIEDSLVVNGAGTAPPEDFMSWQDSWVARVVRFVRVRVRESMNDHRGRATAAVTILTLWMAWRHRRRFVANGTIHTTASVAIQTILRPLLEIVDALMPSDRQ